MSYSATVTTVTYRDPSANSNKFYRAYVLSSEDGNDHRVLFNWGRQGANGQFKVQVCYGQQDALAMADGKIYDKQRKGYGDLTTRELSIAPADLLASAGVSHEARDAALTALSKDPFAALEAGTDRLIRLVTGPADVQHEAITLKATLDDQLAALRIRLIQAEGSLELATDVLSMKLGV
jgi:predicted DNA-binding WGR domain protein